MTVLIAGGGIGGLTLALSLHQIGVPVKVFESVAELKPLGVGINVLPHAVRELIELGLLDKLDASGVRTRELAYFSKHGKPIWSEPRGLEAGYKWPQFSIHRGTLQQILLDTAVEQARPRQHSHQSSSDRMDRDRKRRARRLHRPRDRQDRREP
jgi:5-methylphenazine-1-carboxylate 1-monooxygenase